jgi:fucose 4-O-acetylase-like acetyltransferase
LATQRRLDLDRARGLAIVLVVFGHLMGRGRPEGMDWYEAAFVAVYAFHMPFFMYLSGTTAWLSGQATAPPAAWPRHIARRAHRLLVPFLLMGAIIVVGKALASRIMHVDAAPQGIADGLFDAFVNTDESPVIMIWYLWVLFFVSLAAPLLLRLPGVAAPWRVAPALALAALLFAVGLPPIAYSNKLADHAVFFAVGLLAGQLGARATDTIDRLWPAAALVLAAALAATLAGLIDRRWALVACGLPALPALHGLVRVLSPGVTGRSLLWLGRHSMVIYLFNTIAIGLTKAMLIKAGVGWTAANATAAVPLLLAAGIFAPVIGKRLVLRHIPPLDRLTD